MAKKDEFSAMFDQAKKDAAKVAAAKIQAAGFRVITKGWGGVTVSFNGRVVVVQADKVDDFLASASN